MTRREIVEQYIAAYNTFNPEAMCLYLTPNVIFRNVSNGQTTLELLGIEAFRQQAQQACIFFSTRHQRPTSWNEADDSIEVTIDYEAVFKMKVGGFEEDQKISLQGKSIFIFENDKICQIEDHS
ncbi:MAG: nuclear transport factor 2 family protein [Runella sp.]